MNSKKKSIGFILKSAIAAVMIFAIYKTALSSYALIDATNAVHITSSRIENATLIIGTHLIYMGSMNDQIYEMAVASAKEANQHKRYYKSEMAGGTWYDITEADTLADITTQGIAVPNKEVESLYLTHHTKSDGLTYYLKKNTSVCLFDIKDPYDLEKMTELEPIKRQYDILSKTENPSDTIKRDLLYIKEIYKQDRKTDETKELDEKIASLYTYYKKLLKDDASPAMCDVVISVMEKLDAARRVKVLEPLNDSQLLKMSQVIGREFVYVEGEITGVKDSVNKYKKEKALEASEEAQKQTTEEIQEKIKRLETELTEIKAERDAKISDKKSDITEDWDRIISMETDAVKIAEYKKTRDEEIKKTSSKITGEYATRISNKEKEINSEKNGKDSKVQQAGTKASSAVLNGGRDILEGFVPNAELLSSISEAMLNVQESYRSYSSKMFAEGTTVLSRTEYRLVNELVEKANSESYVSCDRVVMKLMYLDRINNSVVREADLEKTFMEEELMKEAQRFYRASLEAGTGQEYKLLTSAAGVSAKNQALKNQFNETEIKRNELQFILQAYLERMSADDAIALLEERIGEVESFRTAIKSDAYKNYAEASVDVYEKWLIKTLEDMKKEVGNSALESLFLQKEKLQKELLSALDNNLLDKANEIEAKMEALDLEIEEMEVVINAQEISYASSVSENSVSQNTISTGQTGTVISNIVKMKESVLQDIKNGRWSEVESTLEGLGAMSAIQPAGTMEALKEIYQELARQELLGVSADKLSVLVTMVEEITAENLNYYSAEYSVDDLTALISTFIYGKNVGSDIQEVMNMLNQEQVAIVLAGLGRYGEQNPAQDMAEILNTYGKSAFNSGNMYLFEQLQEGNADAIPTDKLAQVAGFRYIFSDSEKKVTLQNKNRYYTFEAFSNVAKKGNDVQEMSQSAGFQGVIYLPEADVKEYFNIGTQYLKDTSYGVILTEEMEQQAIDFSEFLFNAEEEF